MKRLIIACSLVVSMLTAGSVLRAADTAPGSESTPAVGQKVKQMPFYGTVKAVDVDARTITLVGKEKDRVFSLTDASRIHDGGEAKKLGDVQVGRKVGGLAKMNGENTWVVATLNLGVKQGRATAAEAAK